MPQPADPEHAETLPAGQGKTVLRHDAKDVPDPGEAATLAARAPAGPSAASVLRREKGIEGRVTLVAEELPPGEIAGPAGEARYSVLGEIAHGGMGAIVKIVDNDIRRPVAMKVILGGEDPERLERFVEEAQITGQLEHPNIVPVHELGILAPGEEATPAGPNASGTRPYFTMKLVQGESLEAILDRIAGGDAETRDAFPLSHLLQIFLKVCDAMAFAHSRGVIHRDLKPDNVMVGRFGEVLLMDWGLAKVTGEEDKTRKRLVETLQTERETGRTLEGDVMGTPSYMPPEQADGRIGEIGQTSDIFALGGILYRILTHEPPHTGETVTNVMVKAVRGRVVPARKRRPDLPIPPELESVCARALQKNPGDRYPSVEALVEDVRAFLDRRLVSAHRYGIGARVLRFLQRHPAGALAGGVALILLTIGGALTGVLAARAQTHAAQAEAEGLRRRQAEREKDQAVVKADRAESALSKGRLVSAVLRSAEVELGDISESLSRSFYSARTGDEKRAAAQAYEARIRAFETRVPGDSSSRAAWLAVKAWLVLLSDRGDEADRLFGASRAADGDVACASLFEALSWLSRYLSAQPAPDMHVSDYGVEMGPMPRETEGMKRARERYEELLEEAQKAPVWGETSSKEFQDVIRGLEDLRARRFEAGDGRISRSLGIPEMVWMRSVLLFARATLRYYGKRYDDALLDVERILRRQPENTEAWTKKGWILFGIGIEPGGDGRDRHEAMIGAEEAFTKALALDPEALDPARGRAFVRGQQAHPFEDADPARAATLLEGAVADLSFVLDRDGADVSALGNRAYYRGKLGKAMRRTGRDPDAFFESALADVEAALAVNARFDSFHTAKGIILFERGQTRGARGQDPRPDFLEAADAFGRALGLLPDSLPTLNCRGITYRSLGEVEHARGGDATPWFDKALADFEAMRRIRPEDYQALYGAATVHAARAGCRKDPKGILESLDRAVAIYTEALEAMPDARAALANRATSRCRRAGILMALGEDPLPAYERAEKEFHRILEIEPEDDSTLVNLGALWMSRGRWAQRQGEEAAGCLEKALGFFERVPLDSPHGGIVLRQLPAIALGILQGAPAPGRDPLEACRRAIRRCEGTLARDPGSRMAAVSLLQLKGLEAQQAGGDLEALRRILAEARALLAKHPDLALGHELAGNLCFYLSRAEGARGGDWTERLNQAAEAYRKALALQPDLADSEANLALVLEKTGRFAEATKVYDAAIARPSPLAAKLRESRERARHIAAAPRWVGLVAVANTAMDEGSWHAARALYEEAIASGAASGEDRDPQGARFWGPARVRLAGVLAQLSAGRKAAEAPEEPVAGEEAERLRAEAVAHLRRALEYDPAVRAGLAADPLLAPLADLESFKALAGGKDD